VNRCELADPPNSWRARPRDHRFLGRRLSDDLTSPGGGVAGMTGFESAASEARSCSHKEFRTRIIVLSVEVGPIWGKVEGSRSCCYLGASHADEDDTSGLRPPVSSLDARWGDLESALVPVGSQVGRGDPEHLLALWPDSETARGSHRCGSASRP
jgi:hypothetical protein